MIIDTECSRCNGTGEVVASTPNRWSRFVGWDDLYPDDFTEPCPTCGGSGQRFSRQDVSSAQICRRPQPQR